MFGWPIKCLSKPNYIFLYHNKIETSFCEKQPLPSIVNIVLYTRHFWNFPFLSTKHVFIQNMEIIHGFPNDFRHVHSLQTRDVSYVPQTSDFDASVKVFYRRDIENKTEEENINGSRPGVGRTEPPPPPLVCCLHHNSITISSTFSRKERQVLFVLRIWTWGPRYCPRLAICILNFNRTVLYSEPVAQETS